VAYRKAIDLKSDYAVAHYNLGTTLLAQKKLGEAVTAFRNIDNLLLYEPALSNLHRAERWLALDKQLPDFLAGKAKPRYAQEQIDLTLVCLSYKERYRAAVRFYAGAFAAEPKLADYPNGNRYNAARAAALAAAGQGKDA